MDEGQLCAAYNDAGFVLVPDMLPQELLAELRRETDRLIESARQLKEPNDTYDLEPDHRYVNCVTELLTEKGGGILQSNNTKMPACPMQVRPTCVCEGSPIRNGTAPPSARSYTTKAFSGW
jgi:hypothetical protein